jgi:hypothetical protein
MTGSCLPFRGCEFIQQLSFRGEKFIFGLGFRVTLLLSSSFSISPDDHPPDSPHPDPFILLLLLLLPPLPPSSSFSPDSPEPLSPRLTPLRRGKLFFRPQRCAVCLLNSLRARVCAHNTRKSANARIHTKFVSVGSVTSASNSAAALVLAPCLAPLSHRRGGSFGPTLCLVSDPKRRLMWGNDKKSDTPYWMRLP